MPFYEYQCSACGHHHEELQKISAGPLRKCPACGRSTLRRLVSAPVFRLKGGGWYETDFKADKDGKRNLAGDREPAPDKAKEKEKAAAPPEAAVKTGGETQPAPDKKPEAAAGKPAPARRNTTRRRARK
jgi:putative FmdB family regulatory protein